jgi:hypothetical protein
LVANLGHDLGRAALAEAVGHSLGKPERASNPLSEFSSGEPVGQIIRKELPEVMFVPELDNLAHLFEDSIDHEITRSSSTRNPDLVDVHREQIDPEVRVRKEVDNPNQVLERIEQRPSLRTASGTEVEPVGFVPANDPTAHDDRLDDADLPIGQEPGELLFQRSERSRLDLDQPAVRPQGIDPKLAQDNLGSASTLRSVTLLELAMQAPLHDVRPPLASSFLIGRRLKRAGAARLPGRGW